MNQCLKDLSEKLVVLLDLTLADRTSELAAHDLRFRKFHPRELNLIFQNSPSLFVLEKISNSLFMRAFLKTSSCVLVSASRCISLSHIRLDL